MESTWRLGADLPPSTVEYICLRDLLYLHILYIPDPTNQKKTGHAAAPKGCPSTYIYIYLTLPADKKCRYNALMKWAAHMPPRHPRRSNPNPPISEI